MQISLLRFFKKFHKFTLLLRWRSLQRVLGRKRLRIWLRSRCYGRLVPGQRWRMETRSSLCPGRETAGFLIRILVKIGPKICRLSCRVLKASALLKTSLTFIKKCRCLQNSLPMGVAFCPRFYMNYHCLLNFA